MPLHSALTGSELHENKGVAAASDNTVASATSGATVWRKVNASMMDTSSVFNVNKTALTAVIDDVSTSGLIYIAMPFDCTVEEVYSVLGNAITVADATVTCRNHGGTSMGTLTISYSGSAAGDVDQLTPASNNTFSVGEHMSIETDGASTTASKLYLTVFVTITG